MKLKMMQRTHKGNSCRFESSGGSAPTRRGLAPLELTLTLPILVMIMALMINFGIAGAWKVRTQVNARYAAWRTVNARTGEYNPLPRNWPANTPLTTSAGKDLPDVDQLWDSDPNLQCPCIRGPQLTAPNAQKPITVRGRLELDGFVLEGNAQLQRSFPLLQRALPNGGKFQFNLKQDIFDNQWQFYSLNIPFNDSIRAQVWWKIQHSDIASLDPTVSNFDTMLNSNLSQLQTVSLFKELAPLDEDEEFVRYYGTRPPDFYPRLKRMCESDPDIVYLSAVSRVDKNGKPNPNSLLSRIDNLPCSMSGSFTGMYKKWICQLETCNFPDGEISPLRNRYSDLEQFMRSRQCPNTPPDLQKCKPPPMSPPFPACPPSPVGVGH